MAANRGKNNRNKKKNPSMASEVVQDSPAAPDAALQPAEAPAPAIADPEPSSTIEHQPPQIPSEAAINPAPTPLDPDEVPHVMDQAPKVSASVAPIAEPKIATEAPNSSRRTDLSGENKGGQKNSEVLYVGIDLGTYQSTVCASNGVRKRIESLVGWPKDIVARRVVGKPIVFGEECHKHKLSLDMYRPLEWGMLKRGASRIEEAARALVRHLVELAEPESYQKVYAVVGAPSEASHYQVAAIRDSLQGVSEAALIVSEPFAVAYGMGYLNNALIIDIGAGTTDLCLMHGAVPTDDDQMTLNQAGDFIDQQLHQLLQERYPEASFTLKMCRMFKEEHSFVGNAESAVKVTMPVNGVPTVHDITRPVKRACESILPYMKEAVKEMVARFDPEFQEELRQRVVLAGGGSRIRGLADFVQSVLEEQGGGKAVAVEDPFFALADGALAIAQDTPLDQWDALKVDR